MIAALEALERLQTGNQRFVANECLGDAAISHARRAEATLGQSPFAIILGCSDARVPAELVFDQGIGDLFVIRVAGNIVAPSLIGSVEFAASQFGTRLVVVLGHSRCGAVKATLDELLEPGKTGSLNLRSIVNRVRPSVQGLLKTDLRHNHDALIQQAVRSNVQASVNQLRYGSDILEDLIEHQGLAIVGAEYDLDTGVVDFFEGLDLLPQK
ncbi:carbonic anhydrase [Cellvibrio polysaccharolyticus]|uniref:Carbonic anhydrase n=1 Tax=Cellvibrio polysaccharolyticus TaxID=2082724 RepID=A0A928YUN1_9GAMM|nr:carbonic anhydrase [Cellvibrio polysaccharolyticus]MBE8718152.1 carbonic anhydrase [Cellvibrio polysaccharolyticus]